jgi:hypothetical protein
MLLIYIHLTINNYVIVVLWSCSFACESGCHTKNVISSFGCMINLFVLMVLKYTVNA